MNRVIYILALLALVACERPHNSKPVRLRMLNAMPGEEALSIVIKGPEQEVQRQLLYKQSTPYLSLPKGEYEIRVKLGKRELLKGKRGLASGEAYTLILQGYPQLSQQVNQQTFAGKLHWIFGGAEASSPNGYLPGMKLLRDELNAEKKQSKLRVVNAFAGAGSFSITAYPRQKKLAKKLVYPMRGSIAKLKPGDYRLAVALEGMPQALLDTNIRVESCTIYSLVLSGDLHKHHLSLIQISNPATSCP